MAIKPSRGEVWQVNLDPVVGHEQGRVRPCLVVSHDIYNHGPSGIVAIVPITSRDKGVALHVPVDPPEGGLTSRSFIECDDVGALPIDRFSNRRGEITLSTMRMVDDRLRIFLSL